MKPLWLEREPASRHGTAATAFLLFGVAPALFIVTLPISALATTLGVACALAPGVALAVRIERVLVYADHEAVLLRGYLWTRRIALTDVVGVEGNTLFWCGPRGRLRSSRMAALSDPVSRAPWPTPAHDVNRREQARMRAWIEQAVGVRIKRRARLVGHLDDTALAREVRVSAAGVRWEGRRRRLRSTQPTPRWGELRATAEQETAARAGAAAKTR